MTAAGRVLHVSQPALSTQIRKLEKALGEDLFDRSGRELRLTEVGRTVFRYADEIFALGDELTDAVRGVPGKGPLRLSVGIVEAFPKILAHHLIAPALEAFEHLHLSVFTAPPEQLYARLAVHDLDIVISDAPLPTTVDVRAYDHLLAECGVSVVGSPELAERYGPGFPDSLQGAPFLLPGHDSMLRRQIRHWCADRGIEPRIVAEIQDSAVLKVFGRQGLGLFALPSSVEAEVCRMYEVTPLGMLPGLTEQFWAISAERRIRNPAVAAIAEAAGADRGA